MKFADKTRGFTIVEMLTVMGIIAILIGLLVPALNQVKDFAKQVQQKSQFHSIDVALELFKTEFGTYPESSDNLDPYTGNAKYVGATRYCGANKLAEALVGLDYLGFHPNSDFRADGYNYVVDKINTQPPQLLKVYHLSADIVNWETAQENLKARKGPFIDFENANAFRMDEVYGIPNLGGFASSIYAEAGVNYYPPVLCDVFSKKRSGTGSKKTGMPILYYRARTMYTEQRYNNNQVLPSIPGGILDDIYYYPDNENLLSLGTPEDPTIMHPLRDDGGSGGITDLIDFESLIVNKQVTSIKRPYRAGSYILISAGKDGLYGTGDDLFNFDKGSEQ